MECVSGKFNWYRDSKINIIGLQPNKTRAELTDVTRLNFFEVARAAFFSKARGKCNKVVKRNTDNID